MPSALRNPSPPPSREVCRRLTCTQTALCEASVSTPLLAWLRRLGFMVADVHPAARGGGPDRVRQGSLAYLLFCGRARLEPRDCFAWFLV